MQSTIELLDALKLRHNLASDYKVAKFLDLSQQTISAYRLGRNFFDDSIAIRVAELLDLDPAFVLACVHAERAKKPEVKAVWEKIARAASAAALFFMVLGVTALDAGRSLAMYIM